MRPGVRPHSRLTGSRALRPSTNTARRIGHPGPARTQSQRATVTEHVEQFPQPMELPVDERESVQPLRAQLIRFVITGVLSAVVDFGLLLILMQLGLGNTWAKSASFVAGTTTAYLINRRWTFKAPPSKRRFLA